MALPGSGDLKPQTDRASSSNGGCGGETGEGVDAETLGDRLWRWLQAADLALSAGNRRMQRLEST